MTRLARSECLPPGTSANVPNLTVPAYRLADDLGPRSGRCECLRWGVSGTTELHRRRLRFLALHNVTQSNSTGWLAISRSRTKDWIVLESTARPLSARAERRAVVALLTAFALLVQALIPTLASAAPMSPGEMTLCTLDGVQSAPGGPIPDPSSTDHSCQHGLCPAIATTPPPVVSLRHVVYVLTEAPVADTPRGFRPQARAPPRPPGQGPPLSHA